jgi:hypothetical protein
MTDKQYPSLKAEEAAQFRALNAADDALPSYSFHTSDDPYTEGIPNYGTGLLSLPDPEDEHRYDSDSYNGLLCNPTPEGDSSIPPRFPETTFSKPLSPTLDKALSIR